MIGQELSEIELMTDRYIHIYIHRQTQPTNILAEDIRPVMKCHSESDNWRNELTFLR